MMICGLSVEGSAEDSYEVPLTEYGQPDFQGSWGIRFSTPLERYDGMPLVLTPEFAKKFLTHPVMPYSLVIQTLILTFLALSSLSQLRESLDRQCWYIPKMENCLLTSAV